MAVWVVWALVTRPSAGWEVGDSVAVRCPLGERPWAAFAFPRRGRAHLSARAARAARQALVASKTAAGCEPAAIFKLKAKVARWSVPGSNR
jgi:hypothetical protein